MTVFFFTWSNTKEGLLVFVLFPLYQGCELASVCEEFIYFISPEMKNVHSQPSVITNPGKVWKLGP